MSRKYILNENFFDKIDTEEKAYILGFIYGDGYNSEKKNCIKIRLQISDEELLLKFIKILYPNNDKILYYQKKDEIIKSCELVIESKHMSEVLASYGCIQRKSKKLYYPSCVPEELTSHFIRGVFDADGTVYQGTLKTGPEKGYKKSYFSIIGYIVFIKQIQEKIVKFINLIKNKLIKSHAKDVCSVMYSGDNQTEKILDWIYKDANIYLERKYKKYIELKKYLKIKQEKKEAERRICSICGKNIRNKKQYYYKNILYCFSCLPNEGRQEVVHNWKKPDIKDYNPILKGSYYICNIDDNVIYIDKEDLKKLINKNYHIENGYVVHTTRIDKNKKVVTYLQREILSGGCIGFRNGNKLDLRKENLYVRY